jgi:hypothetical protein
LKQCPTKDLPGLQTLEKGISPLIHVRLKNQGIFRIYSKGGYRYGGFLLHMEPGLGNNCPAKVHGLLRDNPRPGAKDFLAAKARAMGGFPKHKCIQEVL